MACKYIDGDYIFHQPCGLWNAPCVHDLRYLHLSSSMPERRKKCCANGRLSSASNNIDKELMMDHELNQLPNFLNMLIFSCCGFSQKSSTYNNLVAMAATVVCNYFSMPQSIQQKHKNTSRIQSSVDYSVENFKPNESFGSNEGTDDVVYDLVVATINHQPTSKNQGHYSTIS